MKKNKTIVLQQHQSDRLVSGSKFTFRAIVRYSTIVVYASLITWLLLDIKSIPTTTVELYTPIWNLIIIFGLVAIAIITLKMNQYFLNGRLLNVLMTTIGFGFAITLILMLKGTKVLDAYKFYEITYWVLGMLMLNTLWLFVIAYTERKTRPFFSRSVVYKIIVRLFIMAAIGIMHWFIKLHIPKLLNQTGGTPIDTEDKLVMMHIMTIAIFLVIPIIITIWRLLHFRKRISNEEITQALSLSIATLIGLPMAIWFTITSLKFESSWQAYVFLAGPIVAIAMIVTFSLYNKSELASPKVFRTIMSLAIFIIWINKFVFEFLYPYVMESSYTVPVTLIAATVVSIFALIKNIPLSKPAAWAFASFVAISNLIMFLEWTLTSLEINVIDLPFNLNDMLNGIIIIDVASMVTASIASWYIVQARISRNVKQIKETKKMKNHDLKSQTKHDKKEAKNA